MSALLALHDWLGMKDAIRYAKHIGLETNDSDFFSAYTVCEFPLKIDFKNPAIYIFEPSADEKSYPHRVYVGENVSYERWESEKGFVSRIKLPLDVAKDHYQNGYGLDEAVWVLAMIGDIDFNADFDWEKEYRSTVPFYRKDSDWGEEGYRVYFEMILWSHILHGSCNNLLLFSRVHIEKLVSRALGRPELVSEEPSLTNPVLLPAFSDSNHESYPPELHAAQLLWEGLYINGEKNPHHPHQQAATTWLEKNKDKLPTSELANAGSDAMIKRLVTITTPSAKKAKK